MFITQKIRLYPTEEQINQFKEYCNASRFVYNACLAKCIDEYQVNGIYLQKYDIIRYADSLKYNDNNSWLKRVSSGVARVAAKDLNTAFDMFYKGACNFPRYKKKGKTKLTFGLKSDSTHCRFVDSTHLKFSKIKGLVRIRKHVILNKLYDPRIYFDNKFWYIYASSKLCSSCGHSKKSLALSERVYTCENCGLVIDRDLNAAINLELYGKRVLAYTI